MHTTASRVTHLAHAGAEEHKTRRAKGGLDHSPTRFYPTGSRATGSGGPRPRPGLTGLRPRLGCPVPAYTLVKGGTTPTTANTVGALTLACPTVTAAASQVAIVMVRGVQLLIAAAAPAIPIFRLQHALYQGLDSHGDSGGAHNEK